MTQILMTQRCTIRLVCARVSRNCQCVIVQVRINAWFGRNTVSCMHTDPPHNLLCQVKCLLSLEVWLCVRQSNVNQVVGYKVIRLYHPRYSDCMYPHEGMMSNTSQVRARFYCVFCRRGKSGFERQVDPDSVDHTRFPMFATAPYSELVLAPGEM
jgi:[protein]-arginine 3-hydroxylase / protease